MSVPALGLAPFQLEFFAGAVCFVIIAILVIFILIAVWVYRDAESRGMSGVLWLILVILFPLIGLILYAILRADHPVGGVRAGYQPYPPPYPPQYPPQQPPAPPQTQAAAPAAGATCRNCGAPLNPGAAFCPRCGAKT